MAKIKNVTLVIIVAVVLLFLAALAASPFALSQYRLYVGRAWVEAEMKTIKTSTDDPLWVEKEKKSLKWQNTWRSNTMMVMSNGSWLAYSSKCGAGDWQMDTILIARASNGKWYTTPYHICESACDQIINQDAVTDDLATFLERHQFTEFGGDPKNCFKN